MWWDLAWLGFGSVISTDIFFFTDFDVGPAIVIFYTIVSFSALLSIIFYAEFAFDIHSIGSETFSLHHIIHPLTSKTNIIPPLS
ncbi:hypothetical protein QJS10_CPA09g01537 [Acorus calamus]|uniref:Uncharacterized protein n=1 Tax=Acorus calamus TaxID=4465 RepID=A0AAV9E8C4_ACOCL|nr:hypothetical protein QJS10_CPA09g01537 [Acorus calamus]